MSYFPLTARGSSTHLEPTDLPFPKRSRFLRHAGQFQPPAMTMSFSRRVTTSIAYQSFERPLSESGLQAFDYVARDATHADTNREYGRGMARDTIISRTDRCTRHWPWRVVQGTWTPTPTSSIAQHESFVVRKCLTLYYHP